MIKMNKDFITGAVLGFGAGFLTKSLSKDGNPALRNLLKTGIQAAFVGVEKFKEGAFGLKETVEDLVAEVKAERDPEQQSHSEPKAKSAKSGKVKLETVS